MYHFHIAGCTTTEWTDWSECPTSCTQGDEKIRTRDFVTPYNISTCPGIPLVEKEPCKNETCEFSDLVYLATFYKINVCVSGLS